MPGVEDDDNGSHRNVVSCNEGSQSTSDRLHGRLLAQDGIDVRRRNSKCFVEIIAYVFGVRFTSRQIFDVRAFVSVDANKEGKDLRFAVRLNQEPIVRYERWEVPSRFIGRPTSWNSRQSKSHRMAVLKISLIYSTFPDRTLRSLSHYIGNDN